MSIDKFKAFLFDLDDTLVDSSQVVYLSMKKWCAENNIDLELQKVSLILSHMRKQSSDWV
ncbi:MAG: HAD hydrolase-like protein [Anaerolineae bacterium]|nr:HAD hydrolase-like protein [Anaerolineae bacterium]